VKQKEHPHVDCRARGDSERVASNASQIRRAARRVCGRSACLGYGISGSNKGKLLQVKINVPAALESGIYRSCIHFHCLDVLYPFHFHMIAGLLST
jgi:hypothetical protein